MLTARRAQLESEIHDLRTGVARDDSGWGREWAGTYYYGDGYSNTTFALAPKGGVVRERRGCLSREWDEGAVTTVSPNHIRVQLNEGRDIGLDLSDDTDFYFVRWGDRRYLVSGENMPKFCGAINTGRLDTSGLKRDIFGAPGVWVPVRMDDERASGFGRPTLPAEFESLIPAAPIRCSLVGADALATSSLYRDGSVVSVSGQATVNAGRRQGLAEGMELALLSPPEPTGDSSLHLLSGMRRIVVDRVDEESATVRFSLVPLTAEAWQIRKDRWVLGSRPLPPSP